MYSNKSISEFLKELGSKNSLPGGGSAAAITGAVTASLVCFISNLTIGKKKYEKVEVEVQQILTKAEKLLKDLEGMIDEDSQMLKKILESYKSSDKDVIGGVSRDAVSFSMDMAQKCVEVMELVLDISKIGNRMLKSDFEVAAFVGDAAVNSSISNVKINLQNMKDEEYSKQTAKTYTKLIKESTRIKNEIIRIANQEEGESK